MAISFGKQTDEVTHYIFLLQHSRELFVLSLLIAIDRLYKGLLPRALSWTLPFAKWQWLHVLLRENESLWFGNLWKSFFPVFAEIRPGCILHFVSHSDRSPARGKFSFGKHSCRTKANFSRVFTGLISSEVSFRYLIPRLSIPVIAKIVHKPVNFRFSVVYWIANLLPFARNLSVIPTILLGDVRTVKIHLAQIRIWKKVSL